MGNITTAKMQDKNNFMLHSLNVETIYEYQQKST